MAKKLDFAKHNQETIEYYDRDKKTMHYTGNRYTEHHIEHFLKITELKAGDRVLDVGCGMGRYTIPLAEAGIKVEGLDLSPYLLERLQEYDGGRFNIPTYCVDIIDFAPQKEYDAVVGFFALHHMHDLNLCFEAMHRLVKPGGQVAFIEPNAYNVLYYLQMLVTPGMTWAGDKGIAKMYPRHVFPAMKKGGLENTSVYRFGFFPPFVTNRPWGLWLEERLERFPIWHPLLPAAIFRGFRPA